MEYTLQSIEQLSREKLIDYLNEFIKNDFSKVVQLLYRIDVSEQKLKKVLQENPDSDAASLIADLIIERLAAAKKARENFSNSKVNQDKISDTTQPQNSNTDEEERL